MKTRNYILTIVLLLCTGTTDVFGQSKIAQKETDKSGHVSFMKYAADTVISLKYAPVLLKKLQPKMKDADEWKISVKRKEIKDENGYTHQFYQQYYKGFKVEGGEFGVHAVNENIESVLGNFEPVGEVTVTVKLSESEALKCAIKHTGAEIYKWQVPEAEQWKKEYYNDTYYPKGELVIVKDWLKTDSVYCLAYRFDIYAHKPMSSNYVWVDAITGEVINMESRIHFSNATGTAATRYSGTRTITADSYNNAYRLRETRNGVSINTYNMQFGTNTNNAIDFVDNDNNWTVVEYNNANRDNAALDAHWGAEMVLDYFKQVHNRNSWNGSGGTLTSYVNADMASMGHGTDNAFWSPQDLYMVYGYGTVSPLTTLDICAHEIGHAVCQATANLGVAAAERGAINESLSDIWGACVENWATTNKQTWICGEDLGLPFRSMSNPNIFGDPDTYQGNFWYSGTNASTYVHTNSGVGNFWFYLLSQGGNGTNDIGNAYSVTGIGITKAARIVYRAETSYLTSSANYAQFRNATISAATNLYGANSQEVISVTNAWYAVGVGNFFPVSLSGPSMLCSGASATLTVSNAPSGFTWTCSPNLTKTTSGHPTTATFVKDVSSSGSWVKIMLGSTELARKEMSSCASVTIPAQYGCDGTYHYGRIPLQSVGANGITQYGWQVSSGTIIEHPVGCLIPMDFVRIIGGNGSLYVRGYNSAGWTEWFYVGYLTSCSSGGGGGLGGLYSTTYPNPVSDVLNIEISAVADTLQAAQASKQQIPVSEVKLYNQSGTLVRSLLATDTHIQLNVADLPAGIYYLHVGKKGKTPEIKTIIINR